MGKYITGPIVVKGLFSGKEFSRIRGISFHQQHRMHKALYYVVHPFCHDKSQYGKGII